MQNNESEEEAQVTDSQGNVMFASEQHFRHAVYTKLTDIQERLGAIEDAFTGLQQQLSENDA